MLDHAGRARLTQFTISAFYDTASGGVEEVYLKKNGSRAFYDDESEAVRIAELMFHQLPRARSVEVWIYGTSTRVKVFRREKSSQSETQK